MPSPLPATLAAPAVVPVSPVVPARSGQPDANASGEGFSQALEQAQVPREQAPPSGSENDPGRGPLRLHPRANAEGAQPLRPQAHGTKGKALDEADAESTLPLPEPDHADAAAPATDPAGIAALLAQWRASPSAAAAAAAESRMLPAEADAADARGNGTGTGTGTDTDPSLPGAAAWSALATSQAAAGSAPNHRRVAGANTALQGAASTTALINDKAFSVASLAAAGTSPSQSQSPQAEAFALPAALPLSAAPAGAATAAATTPTGAQAQLSASPGSALFAAQLGAQITTFVRDGIQNARLHLNPAEMGPVSVRIQLDGSQALIHLGADQSATRQALEQAMPLLASSLREAGLTLAGGGVFEQARQGQSPDAQTARDGQAMGRSRTDPSQPGRDSDALAAPLPGRRRGVVDLVA